MGVAAGLLATLVAAPVLAGCGTAVPPNASDGLASVATIPPVVHAQLRYACEGGLPFPADLVERVRTDELAGDPAAAALRSLLANQDPEMVPMPTSGWSLSGRTGTAASYVSSKASGQLFFANLVVEDGAWRVPTFGVCVPNRVLPDGVGPASWVLTPGQSPGATTLQVEALVTEQACASGRSSEDRVVGPDIVELDDQVLVTFGVRSLPGDQECPGNPPTPVVIVLPEPLGNRQLLDGLTLPPREPVAES